MTKMDERGRVLLPKEIREEMNLKPSEELLIINAGKEMILLKKVNVKQMLGDIIDRVKGLDLEKLERQIEDEGNKITKKKYPKVFS
ncbi:MAG: AbrB/MazE/SpoVT family DNA-binding domain-containing protein [Candidatus Methanoperedens sp.]|nr:AbrB/MazE/SpoVT family DNA-binding domain-containing protein [Candidatus Methanoperedens sp.]MCZ7370038.1 AbrB/MazE/SpoVT family DNA-binding domain-containing protein [Candidatus Methanoperedens sp.]